MSEQQLSLDIDAVTPSLSNSDSDAKMAIIQRYPEQAATETQCSVNEYSPSRRKKKYYRLSWRDGKRMKHLHIPGGNVNSILAQYRARKLQEMIDHGAELGEIIAAVKTYAQGKLLGVWH